MSNFKKKLNIIAQDTNKYLKRLFLNTHNHSYLMKSMQYGIFSGGKRFRSAIIVNTGKIFSVNYKHLIAIGAAVECMHSYSLIHDDLPAMDNDELRRGKLSTHKKFNEFTAILAGNSLLTLAFEILSSKKLNLSEKIKNDLILTLAIYSGYSGLAAGQHLDLTLENKKVTKNKVIELQKNKTGKLFAFCCECVGIIKGQNLKKRKILKKIGLDIGLLFQIADDLIDARENSKTAGKLTKKDKNRGKPTLVNLLGYKKTLDFAFILKNRINKKIEKYGFRSQNLIQSVEFILERKF